MSLKTNHILALCCLLIAISACTESGNSGSESDGDTEVCPTGNLGCPCYGNDTCNDSYSCKDGVCIDDGSSNCDSNDEPDGDADSDCDNDLDTEQVSDGDVDSNDGDSELDFELESDIDSNEVVDNDDDSVETGEDDEGETDRDVIELDEDGDSEPDQQVQCTEGLCCDLGTHTLRGVSYICKTGIESGQFRCYSDSCGGDVEELLKKQYCNGQNAQCTGRLEDEGWMLKHDCTDSQRCHPEEFTCEAFSFYDSIQCEGLDRYYYNTCGQQEKFIETCDDDDDCTVDSCSPQECVNTPYSCNEHGECNSADEFCNCEVEYSGNYCEQCAEGSIEFPLESGTCIDNPCDPDPCNGLGTCSYDTGVAVCECPEPYSGPYCESCMSGSIGSHPYCYVPPEEFCETNLCSPIHPTGQLACYEAFFFNTISCGSIGGYPPAPECQFPNMDCSMEENIPSPCYCGQDPQYEKNSRSFACIDSSDIETPCGQDESATPSLTVDSLTGLIWQSQTPVTYQECTADPESKYCTWHEAIVYCQNLSLGGFDDWTLPTPHELVGIMDIGKSEKPFIDSDAFPSTDVHTSAFYWTSQRFASYDSALSVSFVYASLDTDDFTHLGKVRCVRNRPHYSGPEIGQRYHEERDVPNESVVIDAVTGLMWNNQPESCFEWWDCLHQCEDLDFGGYQDWRVPDLQELLSVVDYSTHDPATRMPGIPRNNGAWTSSKRSRSLGSYYVTFVAGIAHPEMTDGGRVYCVRNAE